MGARNRVDDAIKKAKEAGKEYDYYAAIESGITDSMGKWEIVNVAVIKDKTGYESFGTSPGFPVPEKYVDEIISTDLGRVMDRIFSQTDLRSGKGGIALLTHNEVSRIGLTKEAFIMALTSFVNGDIWKD